MSSETLERAYRLLLESREQKGLETYGETLDTSQVDMKTYLVEEMADAVMYAAGIIRNLEIDVEVLFRNYDALVRASTRELGHPCPLTPEDYK